MSAPAPNSFRITTAPDLVYGVWDDKRFETKSADWTQVPGAEVHLMLGQGWPSQGAQFVATFSAEALCSDNDDDGQGVLQATVFFGDEQGEPVSTNHRFATARGKPEWSSHTLIRTVRFEPDTAERDVSARVKLKLNGAEGGVQNWFLKIERFSL
ncbi:hypothetical protein [Streptomyces sp. JW3]|uniref:hypothetical protein n=1 Tax=Streptomyces sp. JW3 TaxID=3456955 RepID=UPI003FA4C5DF